MSQGLPHWEYGDDPDERIRRQHENFEWLTSQTEAQLRDSLVHPGQETLGEVTTTSTTFVALSGNPSITVQCRSGLIVAVLMEAEMKNSLGGVERSALTAELDSSGTYVGGAATTSTTYVRQVADAGGSGNTYPAGSLCVFPATATSHTLTMKYRVTAGTGSFKNRRIWAWVL